MADRRRMPYRAWLLVLLLAALAVSATGPFDRRDWLLEHMPTAAAFLLLVWYERRPGGAPLSNLAYTLVFLFTALHILGAHHLYSRVPYVEWWTWLSGAPAEAPTGARNHYDRFVHFSFGLLLLQPMAEVVRRHVARGAKAVVLVTIAFQAVLSTLYEVAEWVLAVVVSPDQAEAYNGQQGDFFDPQKDMALALLGALVAAPWVVSRLRRAAH
jgi:putative membrane protein